MKLLVFLATYVAFGNAVNFEIHNYMGGQIWIGIIGNDGKEALANGGFTLDQGESRIVNSTDDWAGTFWARTWCDFGGNHCLTGDCGNRLECAGNSGEPPATLVEIALRVDDGNDSYDISLVYGMNAKASIEPVKGDGDCKRVQCEASMDFCPEDLRVMNNDQLIACESTCTKFETDEFCCSNDHDQQENCKSDPSTINYAAYFKNACPDARIYGYDNTNSTFTCNADTYVITFS